ncbi:hypothetical protein FHR32_005338 [Streptosporangium album]|uniref:Uncharacterized protein n=1 Tax=Streptosporangium album TaxID=47479 RepID=A0A7W7S107_9ACTN|nr:hypothetical protein [Streptosporangium album]MBB4940961.1 hypothetical protein [Streptosporangium album]
MDPVRVEEGLVLDNLLADDLHIPPGGKGRPGHDTDSESDREKRLDPVAAT